MILSTETRWLIDNLSTVLLLFDRDLKLCAINTAGESLLSLGVRQIMGQTVDELLKNSAITRAAQRALFTGHPLTERDIKLYAIGQAPINADCIVTPLTEAQYVL